MEFPLKQREPIRLGPIQFRFTRVGISGPDLLADTVRLVAGDIQSPRCPFAAVQVDLFKYPELSPNAGKSLSFELVAAFDGDGKKTKLGLRGLDFKKLDIDLFRFMRLRIDEIEQSHKNHNNYLGLNGIKLEILGRTILENLFVAFFDAAGRRGSPRTSGGRSRGRGTPSSRRSRRGSRSSRACSSSTGSWSRTTSSSTRPRPPPRPGRHRLFPDRQGNQGGVSGGRAGGAGGRRGRGFGLGFNILEGVLRAKVLFVDGGSAGLMISSEALEDLFGFKGFAIGYLKGDRPQEDRFWTEFPVPKVAMTAFNFLGGIIGLESISGAGRCSTSASPGWTRRRSAAGTGDLGSPSASTWGTPGFTPGT